MRFPARISVCINLQPASTACQAAERPIAGGAAARPSLAPICTGVRLGLRFRDPHRWYGSMPITLPIDQNILAKSGTAVSLALTFEIDIYHIPLHIARHSPRFPRFSTLLRFYASTLTKPGVHSPGCGPPRRPVVCTAGRRVRARGPVPGDAPGWGGDNGPAGGGCARAADNSFRARTVGQFWTTLDNRSGYKPDTVSSARAMSATSPEPVHMFLFKSGGLWRIPPTSHGEESGLRVALNPTTAPDRSDAGLAMIVTVADSCTGQDRPSTLHRQRWAPRSVQHKNNQSWNEYYPELSTPVLDTKWIFYPVMCNCPLSKPVRSSGLCGIAGPGP